MNHNCTHAVFPKDIDFESASKMCAPPARLVMWLPKACGAGTPDDDTNSPYGKGGSSAYSAATDCNGGSDGAGSAFGAGA